jgi:hypothetical protein
MHPLLAWLPFLAALVVAFGAGVAFARINERLTSTSEVPSRRGGIFGLRGTDAILTTALVALLAAVFVLWVVAVFVILGTR